MHISVLKEEAIEHLNLKEDGIYVDATLGYAGHSCSILKRISKGYLVAIDLDEEAIKESSSKLKSLGDNFKIFNDNYRNIDKVLKSLNIEEVDGILFDLGVSSPEIDNAERGFSFLKKGPLDMRMNQQQTLSAYEVVNDYEYKDLVRILYEYGEEKYAKVIAKSIIKNRPIKTTDELAELLKKEMPYYKDKNPATRTFQAIRIEVNDELNSLEEALNKSLKLLKVGGRLVVISFHSLEDKIVKSKFNKVCEIDPKLKGMPNILDEYLPNYKHISKKVIIPSKEESERNSRSKSAKMRVVERVK